MRPVLNIRRIFSISMLGVLVVIAACSSAPQPLKTTLLAEDVFWSPTEIRAKINQPVELTVRNDGALDHVLVIEELNVEILLSPGDTEIVNFTVDHAGSIEYHCGIPGHADAGMVGEIVVTD